MSILTGTEIIKQIDAGKIVITPFNPERVNPNSVNLTLADKILIYRKHERLHAMRGYRSADDVPLPIDSAVKEEVVEIERDTVGQYRGGFLFVPGVLYLGSTIEWTETEHYVPTLDGRSSVGRLGLPIHVTAGFGDVGFKGTWTLEMRVDFPLVVYPGTEICQISYSTVEGDVRKYRGKYQGQDTVKPSGLWREVSQLKKKLDNAK